ncbi:hypothetical protein EYF80_020902 [Liparis tanakae]|uniref:Uncharacterized protein n=1 Tax=Liparis tanakae TaxID=230148 RepID=A0A4Z2HT27_9TELE|nr:hypothetical protein EYF80_020902 [Liparis tanakae]
MDKGREETRGEAECQQRRGGRGRLLRAAALHLVTYPANGPRRGSDPQAASLQETGPLNSVCPLRGAHPSDAGGCSRVLPGTVPGLRRCLTGCERNNKYSQLQFIK